MSAMVLPAVVLLCSCAGAPLPNSHDTPDALARAVLAAFEKRDADALLALALDKQQFAEHVWPGLPAAKPERNLSMNFVWGDLNQKSNFTLRGLLAAHGGKKYELVAIGFLGETTPYSNYLVHRESELTVRDASGQQQNVRLFGSVIEKAGRFKVFSYVVDD